MNEKSYFLSRTFLRSYGLLGAWSVFGAGVILSTGRMSLVAILLLLVGLVMAVVSFRNDSLKEGDYPRTRALVMLITVLGEIVMGLFLRVFVRGPTVAIWWTYLAGIVLLVAYSTMEFVRSIRQAGPQI